MLFTSFNGVYILYLYFFNSVPNLTFKKRHEKACKSRSVTGYSHNSKSYMREVRQHVVNCGAVRENDKKHKKNIVISPIQ